MATPTRNHWFTLVPACILFGCFLALVVIAASLGPSKFFVSPTREGISLLRDDQELGVFYKRITFAYQHQLPYQHQRIEYPPLAVAYLALPTLFSSSYQGYRTGLMVQNVVFAMGLLAVTLATLRQLGLPSRRWLLFLLPSFAYQVVNRFDVLPALIVQLAFLFLFRKRYQLAFLALSVAFLAKGYSVIFFPIFFLAWLHDRHERGDVSLLWNTPLKLFVLPIAAVTAGTCALVGIERGLFPYIFQSLRGFAYGVVYIPLLYSFAAALSHGQ
ncbi:MAG: hypothetical protein V1916_03140, partial [Patescibacteria group bacterium]